jgi:DNA-binding PucR family transcriptional regulator
MIITCNNIFKLPFLEKIKVVAGKKGLNNIIRWVHVMEYPQYTKWLKGGELLLITGVAIKDDINVLTQFVNDISYRNVAGLVINIGPYITETPKEVIELADSLDFPVFELPFDVKLIDVSQSICNAIFMSKMERESMDSFMKDIIFRNVTITEEILNKAIYYGYDPKKTYFSFVIYIDNYNYFTEYDIMSGKENVLQFKQNIEQIILDIMVKWNKKTIHINQSDSIIIIVPINEKHNENHTPKDIAEDLIKNIQFKIQNLNVSIGIGSYLKELKDLKKSIYNAQKALKLLKISKEKNRIINYSDIGIYRLLFEVDKHEEMKDLYQETLGNLIEYDLKNSNNLLNTLEFYIEQSGNLAKTAELLFIHKNTLIYRIRRIEEILGCDLKNTNDLLNFSVALKIGKFLNCI